MKIIILVLLTSMLLLGCSTYEHVTDTEEKPECTNDSECYDVRMPYACINNTCEVVECIDDNDCNTLELIYSDKCVNYTCINYISFCKDVAMKDYGMDNPECEFFPDTCYCRDKVIDTPEERIVHENSIEIIREKYHYENNITLFELT